MIKLSVVPIWVWGVIAAAVLAGAVTFHLVAVDAAFDRGVAAEAGKNYEAISKAIKDATATFLRKQAEIDEQAKRAVAERERRVAEREKAVASARAHLKESSDALLADDGLADLAGWLRAVNAARAAARPRPD